MSNWQDRGANAVNAGADLITGIAGALGGIGARLKRGKHAGFIEAFTAVTGHVMSQNGKLLPEEIQALEQFLLNNHQNPAFSAFESADIVAKVKEYATKAFMGDEAEIVRAVTKLERGGDSAKMTIIAALAIAFADGDCDQDEINCIQRHAQAMNINMGQLAAEFSLALPGIQQPSANLGIPQSTGAPQQATTASVVEQQTPSPVQQVAPAVAPVQQAPPTPTSVAVEKCPMCKPDVPGICKFCKRTW